jgi:hypothetical protein
LACRNSFLTQNGKPLGAMDRICSSRAPTGKVEEQATWGASEMTTAPVSPLQKIGGEFLVNTVTQGNQWDPSIASLTNGGFVVTWDARNSGLAQPGVAQVFDATGAKVGSELVLDPGGATVSGMSDGGFVLSWIGPTTVPGSVVAYPGVLAEVFDATGADKLGRDIVLPGPPNGSTSGTVAGLSNDDFVIAQTYGPNIFAQVFDGSTGAAITGYFKVNTTTGSSSLSSPTIAALTDNDFVVTWIDNGLSVIRGQIFNASGSAVGSEFIVTSTSLTGVSAITGLN